MTEPTELTTTQTPADDRRRASYMAALSLTERLIAESPVLPDQLDVKCATWQRDGSAALNCYFHLDLNALTTWHAHCGGALTVQTHADGQIRWATNTVLDGIGVEAWTLLDAEPVTVLPVRERHNEAVLDLLDRWSVLHGDPAHWDPDIRHCFAATVANMRSGGTS